MKKQADGKDMASTSPNPQTEVQWDQLPWHQFESRVGKLQQRIYYNAKHGMWKKVRDLQRLLLASCAAKALAIRKITQYNHGKITAGLDEQVFLTDASRMQLFSDINIKSLFQLEYQPTPVRRVWIPKSSDKFRPLGIPTMIDRIYQELIRMALEPEYESKFHGNSFGFRPGRCCQDAIEAIKIAIKEGYISILDADLTKCFDRINHHFLLTQIPVQFRRIISKWLKAGVVEMGQLQKTEEGTPQGGVISPMLANIALNPLDHAINKLVGVKLIRYADDMIVLSKRNIGIESVISATQEILKKVGPELNPEKTRVTTPEKGFKFLGFHFIRYPRKTLWIQPESERVTSFLKRIKLLIDTHKQVKTEYLILGLNQRLRGWANYYRFCRAFPAFERVANSIWRWIWRWCFRRHPRKGRQWVYQKYFLRERERKWRLTALGFILMSPFDIKRMNYDWRVGTSSTYDPDRTVQERWQRKRDGQYYTFQRPDLFR